MSKELTEQLLNGTLKEGDYWCEVTESPYVEQVHLPCCDDIVVEVLAPVPTYDQFVELTEKVEQFSQMEKKVHILNEAAMNMENAIGSQADYFRQQISVLESKLSRKSEQLKEANEVIKFYSDAHQLTDEEKQMTAEKYHLVYGLKALEYIEKWGVK